MNQIRNVWLTCRMTLNILNKFYCFRVDIFEYLLSLLRLLLIVIDVDLLGCYRVSLVLFFWRHNRIIKIFTTFLNCKQNFKIFVTKFNSFDRIKVIGKHVFFSCLSITLCILKNSLILPSHNNQWKCEV